jgi:hypothetical protein
MAMKVCEAINLVMQVFGSEKVKFEGVGHAYVDFVFGDDLYRITQRADNKRFNILNMNAQGNFDRNDAAVWVEGCLLGELDACTDNPPAPKREVMMIDPPTERKAIRELSRILTLHGHNASNSTLVAVSSDYSSIAWQVLRHDLSHDGEICNGFTVDVPYPDQEWTNSMRIDLLNACHRCDISNSLILIEAGVIRGSNYKKLTDLLSFHYPNQNVVTATLYENTHSKFKSMFVAEYYDDTKSDLTFWWEKYNKHWPAT